MTTAKFSGQSRVLVQGFVRCLVSILVVCLFCTAASVVEAAEVSPTQTSFNVSVKLISHLGFFGLLVIGLRIRPRYRD